MALVYQAEAITPQEALETVTAPIVSEQEAKQYIYYKESTNRLDAINPSSGSCGIGQSLPCSKLESVCPDWRTNYECSDQFFTAYVTARYGGWVGAYDFWVNQGHNWY